MPANTYGRQVIEALTNKSGGSVAAGDVVIIDTTNDGAFTTTTTGAFTGLVGVAQETIANNAVGRILTVGYAALVNVNASVTRGNFGKTHTVAKQATDAGSSRVTGAFCQFLKGGTTPDAHIFNSDLGGGSGLTAIANASVRYAGGSITGTHGMSSFAAVHASGLDLTIAAATGDIIEVTYANLVNCSGSGEIFFDVATVVSSSLTNYVSGGSSSSGGMIGLYYQAGALKARSDTYLYTVQAGDISGGNVTFRPVYMNTDGTNNPTIYATGAYTQHHQVVNLKH